MSDPLDRFRHLEDARADRGGDGAAAAPSPHAGRFEGVERPSAIPGPAPATGARLDRFGPEPDPVIELVDTDGLRPFNRCMRCGADANVFATACAGCGASLDTPEQRVFNERLFAARQAESAREAAAAAQRRELADRAAAEDAQVRRAAAEALAREVGDSERRRLEAADPLRWRGLEALIDGLELLLGVLRVVWRAVWRWW